MTERGPDRVREIFKEAIELTGDDRDAFIAAAVGDDQTLRTRVDRLLQAYDIDASNLDQTELTAITTGTRIGGQIGRFRILQKIGEGGFGEVWMAEQTEPIRRRVAIKIIKPGMDSDQVIARFEAERQALAMMEHANIARVYDGGETDEGRPYFVMELVKGMPITEYCDRKKLDLAARIDLFRQVCAGVQHAHQKGVIHRDLKPNNVLVCEVDEKPVPKVIDFGIAKALERPLTDKTLFTEFRQFIGTPEYMSPEQAELSLIDVDTRSDVYALGVMLYELLAGEPPFDPKSLRSVGFDEMRRIIREEEPPPPSSKLTRSGSGKDGDVADPELGKLGKLVRGELDWIVQRAMAKERDRRYASANELEEDLSRYLRSEPVRAGRPGRVYRAQRFVRRNRVGVSFAATGVAALLVIAVLLAIGLIVLSGNYEELQRAQANERAASQKVEESLVARTAALKDVEAAQDRTQSALEDAERARDRAETARTNLDDQVSAMHISRAAELAQSEQMQAIAQLDLVPGRNRNWAWKALRSTLPTRTEIGLLEDAIICDVTRQGDRALVLRLDGYTLLCDVVSLPNGELVSNLYAEDFEGAVEPLKMHVNGVTLPASVQLQTVWSTFRQDIGQTRYELFSGLSFSRDGRRVVLTHAVFDYFRRSVHELSKMSGMLDESRVASETAELLRQIGEAKAAGLDATDLEQKLRALTGVVDTPAGLAVAPVRQFSVSPVVLSVFDVGSGDLVAAMPRTVSPRHELDAPNWVADDAATRILMIQSSDALTGDALLVFLVEENRVLESPPLKLQRPKYGLPVPLAISADGEAFMVAMSMSTTRREQVGIRHSREGDADWERSPVFQTLNETRYRVTVGRVVDGELEINEVLMREADWDGENLGVTIDGGVSMDEIQSLAFTADSRGLFMLDRRGVLASYRPKKTWWTQDDNVLESTAGGSLVVPWETRDTFALFGWRKTNVSPGGILHPVGEHAVLVSRGSRIVQIDAADSEDGGVAALEIAKRFDLGDARIVLAEPPTKEHQASLIAWSDERITRVQLGARVAVIEDVGHTYPTSGAFVHLSNGSLQLSTPAGEIELDDTVNFPWSVSPTGRYAILRSGFVVDVVTGERHALEGPVREQTTDIERGDADAFQDGCWVQSGDGRELIVALLEKGPGAGIISSVLDGAREGQVAALQSAALQSAVAGQYYRNGLYSWDPATGALEHEVDLPLFFVDGGSVLIEMTRAARNGGLVAIAGQWTKLPTMPRNFDHMEFFMSSVMKNSMQASESAVILIDRMTGEVVLQKRLPGLIGGLAISHDGSEVACFIGGSIESDTARVVLLSKNPEEGWGDAEPILRTNNVKDAYLSDIEIRGIQRRPSPILSFSPDGSLLSLVLGSATESRLDLMDPRSNTWLMSWDLEALMGMAGAQFSASDFSVRPVTLGCAAFGPRGEELHIWVSPPSGTVRHHGRIRPQSSLLIRIFDRPVPEPEESTPSNRTIGVSSRGPLPHGSSDKSEEVVVRND